MALTHYPVINKSGDTIASAVTNLDLHDISRAAKTYGVRSFFVVTPLADQQVLVKRIVSHWVKGGGSKYNPKRREALELIRIKDSLKEVVDDIHATYGNAPKTVVTSAKYSSDNISYSKFREMLKDSRLYLLIFGTAWGLTKDCIAAADYVLDPVMGKTEYNHLAVRSATAIILDRLFGTYE